MKTTNEIFAENLKHYVKKSGKTQLQLADAVNVSKGTFSDWMHGRSLPRMRKVEQLADYFKINKSDLLEEKVESNVYHLRKEVAEIAQEIYNSPELKVLFSVSRDLSKEDIIAVTDIVNRMKR